MNEGELCRKGEAIFQSALHAVAPEALVSRNLMRCGHWLGVGENQFNLKQLRNIRVAAIGKAAPAMAEAVADILGDRLESGLYLHRPEEVHKIAYFKGLPAPHPLPDERSRTASQKVLELAEKSGPDDLFLFCISGGGSAQLSYPAPGISMNEKSGLIEALLRAGADIHELNTVRKHLSMVKGGRVSQAAFPAAVVNLVISDVIGNDPSTIASGPGWGDPTTFHDACAVLEKYGLRDKTPDSVKEYLSEGIRGDRQDTPVPENPVLKNVAYVVAGDNRTALDAAREAAGKEGLTARILTSEDCGEAREKAGDYVKIFIAAKKQAARPFCLIAGGELTVTVMGNGKGGRNQEFVLAFMEEMNRAYPAEKNWAVFSLGTDGIDGPTDAAGAGGGPSIFDKAVLRKLNPLCFLNNNDSYAFFDQAGGLIRTGPTHTNVMDIRLFLHS